MPVVYYLMEHCSSTDRSVTGQFVSPRLEIARVSDLVK